MALGLKYYHDYCYQDDGANRVARVGVYEEGYSGPAILMEAADPPFLVSYESDEDFKFSPIRASSADVTFVFGTGNGVDFEELWTANERQFQVRHYVADTFSGIENPIALDWIGWVVPNGFSYQFTGGVYYGRITATDGLGTLEGIPFRYEIAGGTLENYGLQDLVYNDPDDEGNLYLFPFTLIATEILRKLQYNIDTWIAVDYYEQSMNLSGIGRAADPFSNVYANVKTYINNTENESIAYWEDADAAWNCKKVLANICNIFGAIVYQEKGKWRIKSVTADTNNGNQYVNPTFNSDLNAWNYRYYSVSNPRTSSASQPLCTRRTTPFGSDGSPFSDLYTLEPITDVNAIGLQLYKEDGAGGLEPFLGQRGYQIYGTNERFYTGDGFSDGVIREYVECTPTNIDWHKYDTAGTWIGKEELLPGIEIECSTVGNALYGGDHVMSMDDVLSAFRVNYKYQFIRDGDSPIQQIQNGDFSGPFYTDSEEATAAFWFKWRKESFRLYGKYRQVLTLTADQPQIGGARYAVEFGTNSGSYSLNPYAAAFVGLRQQQRLIADKDNTYYFKVDARYASRDNLFDSQYPVFQAVLDGDDGEVYYLRNAERNEEGQSQYFTDKLNWIQGDQGQINGIFFFANATQATNWDSSWDFVEQREPRWYNFEYEIQKPPVDGRITFTMHGLAAYRPRPGAISDFSIYRYNPDNENTQYEPARIYPAVENLGLAVNPWLQITNVIWGYIPNPGDLPEQSDYVAFNNDRNYTFQREPIEVYNGDTQSEEHVSNLYVPSNTSAQNKWNNVKNAFDFSDIGLILAKSVLGQYVKPNRILEGSILNHDLEFGTIFQITALPNIRFKLLRGSFNRKRGIVQNATFVQMDAITIITDGSQNGNTLEPDWVQTNRFRCIKNPDGTNTGEAEVEEIDRNPNSESYNFRRWVNIGVSTQCPLGELTDVYYGTEVDAYDYTLLSALPPVKPDANTYLCDISNTGGKYIYFIHKASLGVVTSVFTPFQDEVISDFQYLADDTIDGTVYKVLRQDYVTTEFSNLQITFQLTP